MAGTLKVKYKHVQPVILHADQLEDFKEALGGQDISSFFREIQEDVVDKYRKEKEKKGKPPAKGALINYIINSNKKVDAKGQTTLDVFAKERTNELTKLFNEFKAKGDIIAIRNFTRNCQLGYDMGKTFFRNKNQK